ncbi:hypothetical protein [Micromonospora sp. LOL_021]|uniref:hypothetical protein n=1 Tax=Micromonospora sp. LOL_021 TaxID=3345417 RepID=UPI003A886A45
MSGPYVAPKQSLTRTYPASARLASHHSAVASVAPNSNQDNADRMRRGVYSNSRPTANAISTRLSGQRTTSHAVRVPPRQPSGRRAHGRSRRPCTS